MRSMSQAHGSDHFLVTVLHLITGVPEEQSMALWTLDFLVRLPQAGTLKNTAPKPRLNTTRTSCNYKSYSQYLISFVVFVLLHVAEQLDVGQANGVLSLPSYKPPENSQHSAALREKVWFPVAFLLPYWPDWARTEDGID